MSVIAIVRPVVLAAVLWLHLNPANTSPYAMVAPPSAARLKLTGTFTTLRYNREGGDVLGTEIRIVGARRGLQATVQIAEGSASDLVLVETVAATPAGKLTFTLPPNDLDLQRFDGIITAKGLDGIWTYTDTKTEVAKLRRGRSYWE